MSQTALPPLNQWLGSEFVSECSDNILIIKSEDSETITVKSLILTNAPESIF